MGGYVTARDARGVVHSVPDSLPGLRDGRLREVGGAVINHVPWRIAAPVVDFLRRAVSSESLGYVRQGMKRDPEDWWVGLHHSWGMVVRNLLRVHGFDEAALGVGNLDDAYVPLLESAAELGPLPRTLSWRFRFAFRRIVHRWRWKLRRRQERKQNP